MTESNGRDELGRWQPGYGPNPTGRPKSEPDIVRQARAASPRAMRRLIELVDHPDPKIAAYAAAAVLDRAYGKPRQSVELDHRVDIAQLHLEAVRRLSQPALAPPAEPLQELRGLMPDDCSTCNLADG